MVSGPSLTIPPNFELRPPSEAGASKADAIRSADTSQDAREILMGRDGGKSAQGSGWLLEQAGTQDADPNIRQDLGTSEEE